jgi:hypothetical protein
MANYALTTTQVEDKSYTNVAATLESTAEAVDTAKAIRLYSIVYRAVTDTFIGTLVVDS